MARFTDFARRAWRRAEAAAVFALCMGAAMILPMSLAAIGFQTL